MYSIRRDELYSGNGRVPCLKEKGQPDAHGSLPQVVEARVRAPMSRRLGAKPKPERGPFPISPKPRAFDAPVRKAVE